MRREEISSVSLPFYDDINIVLMYICMCVYACACVCVCACAHMYACVPEVRVGCLFSRIVTEPKVHTFSYVDWPIGFRDFSVFCLTSHRCWDHRHNHVWLLLGNCGSEFRSSCFCDKQTLDPLGHLLSP